MALFAWSTPCFAGSELQKAATAGDVCDIRPDLCGDAPKVKKKKKHAKKKDCRKRNDERDEVLHLPICGSETADVAGDIEKELMMEESTAEFAATGKRTKRRLKPADTNENAAVRPAATPPAARGKDVESNLDPRIVERTEDEKPSRVKPMNYNDYINKNANHPALANRRSRFDQTAFTETKRVYISPVNPGAQGQAGTASAAGIPGAGGTTTAPPGANPATGTASGIPAASGIGNAPGIAPAAGIAPVNSSGTAGGDPNQTNTYGSDGNQPPPGSSAGN